ncbi:ATP-binding protein [Azospirillum soli]|uniref:ATP-binding protein n=1 Tax=Azospirillum soli TaxID=1304799 RepID=UPI001B3BFF0C|nr:ATP-binding protein [Azospirillum soli]MBP2313513.1 anti-sigma regulatory factor (Ser/Thr protein kinase) [Azospirillum soli]
MNIEPPPDGAAPVGARAFCLVRDRVPADVAARAAARFGLPREGAGASPIAAAILLAGADRDGVRYALDQNAFFTVELTEDEERAGDLQGDWLGAPPVEHGFYLSLTTGSAYGLQCAVLVCDELARRGVLGPERRGSIELCLHEAIANALVHGNLGIASSAKDQPEGYRVFSRMVQERLGDLAVRGRRLDVFARWGGGPGGGLSIAVVDQGGGFDTASLPAETGGSARSGRGFVFMRTLAKRVSVTDGGRCTVLHFDL